MPNAMNDATCGKCGRRFGWYGRLVNRPPCPDCGDVVPQSQLEKEQREVDLVMKAVRARLALDEAKGVYDHLRSGRPDASLDRWAREFGPKLFGALEPLLGHIEGRPPSVKAVSSRRGPFLEGVEEANGG